MSQSTGGSKHRNRRERAPWTGMMVHRDDSDHEWTEGSFRDLIVTMDDATNEHYSMFFREEEGLWSSFRGMRKMVGAKCQYRINTPQKCRLKNPHFGLPPMPPGALAATRRSAFDGPGSPGSIDLVTLREIVMIHDLKRQGLGISAIARQPGLDSKTVRKYLKRGLQTP